MSSGRRSGNGRKPVAAPTSDPIAVLETARQLSADYLDTVRLLDLNYRGLPIARVSKISRAMAALNVQGALLRKFAYGADEPMRLDRLMIAARSLDRGGDFTAVIQTISDQYQNQHAYMDHGIRYVGREIAPKSRSAVVKSFLYGGVLHGNPGDFAMPRDIDFGQRLGIVEDWVSVVGVAVENLNTLLETQGEELGLRPRLTNGISLTEVKRREAAGERMPWDPPGEELLRATRRKPGAEK